MSENIQTTIALDLLEILPNPVLVKNAKLEYVYINSAFESLFDVKREFVVGRLDKDLFPDRQVAQCNGGDLRVLETGEMDEAVETVFENNGHARETITRKNRLDTAGGETFLVGIMHDITDVTRANEALLETQTQLEEQAEKLVKLASTDTLTGCANRRALTDKASALTNNAFGQTACLLLDLDKFKSINDSYGHDAGDDVLKHFVQQIRTIIGENDCFARMGGEEFVILLPDVDIESAGNVAEQIRDTIENSVVETNGQAINYTVSIGISLKPKGESTSLDALIKIADQQLYRAKNSGRNCVMKAA